MKEHLNKLLAFLTAALMCVSVTGCGQDETAEEGTTTAAEITTADVSDTEATSANEEETSVSETTEATLPEVPEVSDMVKRSLVSVGNNQRLLDAIEKAENGEDVTIVYLGGSITQGDGASNSDNCYANLSFNMFTEKFASDPSKMHYVNAGIGATTSTLGILRSGRDVISKNPDIVFVEYAANDGTDYNNQLAYESLVTRLLESESKPAVILIFTVFDNGTSAQPNMEKIGAAYDLGMISVGDAINPEIEAGNMTFAGDYAADYVHPNDKGHQMICDFLEYYFDNVIATEKSPEYVIPDTVVVSRALANLENIGADSDKITSLGSFEEGSYNYFSYIRCLQRKPGTDNAPLTFTAEFTRLLVAVRQNNDESLGSAEIWIDGEKVEEVSNYLSTGWGGVDIKIIVAKPGTHNVEIKVPDESLDKSFYLLDMAIA